MFTAQKRKNSFLFLNNDENYEKQLYLLAFQHTKAGKKVLLMTAKDYNLLQLVKDKLLEPNKEALERMIIMHAHNIETLAHKLLQLHSWTVLPDLMIVDLTALGGISSMGKGPKTDEAAAAPQKRLCVQRLCFCIASINSYLESVKRKKVRQNSELQLTYNGPASLICLQQTEELQPHEYYGFMFPLYFAEENISHKFEILREKLLGAV